MNKQPALAQEQYACVYAWLALLFFREVDDEGLIQLQSAEIADWLALLKRQPALAAVGGVTRTKKLPRLAYARMRSWSWPQIFADCS
ncbi:chaperone protein TorD [Salmonella enterica subsp. enterica]|nr:chaperone protein TorD [Salmonella enterica subsp. enterica]